MEDDVIEAVAAISPQPQSKVADGSDAASEYATGGLDPVSEAPPDQLR